MDCIILPITRNGRWQLLRGGIVSIWVCADVLLQCTHALTTPIGQRLKEHERCHREFGLDVIALVELLRYQRHQCLAEIHQSPQARGLSIGERTVLNLLAQYEELVTLHMTDRERLQPLVRKQRSLMLAVDGLKSDVGHEVLRVVRDCVSGKILLARRLSHRTRRPLFF